MALNLRAEALASGKRVGGLDPLDDFGTQIIEEQRPDGHTLFGNQRNYLHEARASEVEEPHGVHMPHPDPEFRTRKRRFPREMTLEEMVEEDRLPVIAGEAAISAFAGNTH